MPLPLDQRVRQQNIQITLIFSCVSVWARRFTEWHHWDDTVNTEFTFRLNSVVTMMKAAAKEEWKPGNIRSWFQKQWTCERQDSPSQVSLSDRCAGVTGAVNGARCWHQNWFNCSVHTEHQHISSSCDSVNFDLQWNYGGVLLFIMVKRDRSRAHACVCTWVMQYSADQWSHTVHWSTGWGNTLKETATKTEKKMAVTQQTLGLTRMLFLYLLLVRSRSPSVCRISMYVRFLV